ncbi:pyroglutamyl-peptidase I [Microbacterium sp. ARD31]|uniref:pyroglutamyl-peptidase I n=1 Tax=Microbacterium sp. ARD31 TaxID=2962576 RepID=UPI002881E867|nr:pyroglutamyl-peptidase I [Microbacterium sp. ARD31]MDT0183184.1 pyroglutamyl-peptidase I [Microbacterium sp. ARD31]
MTTALLTGFEPFGGDSFNPSGAAVRQVASSWTGSAELVVDVLPVAFAGAANRMRELIARHSPDVVLATGLAGGRTAVGVERIAVNLIDARIPDNEGEQPVDEPSIPGAPAARFASLPVKRIVRELGGAGIPAELSHSAGTYVCNHVFFTALDAAPAPSRSGFVHVPWSREHAPTADAASLPFADIVQAIAIVIDASLADEDDLRLPGGAAH